jgi:hypothetical protein
MGDGPGAPVRRERVLDLVRVAPGLPRVEGQDRRAQALEPGQPGRRGRRPRVGQRGRRVAPRVEGELTSATTSPDAAPPDRPTTLAATATSSPS